MGIIVTGGALLFFDFLASFLMASLILGVLGYLFFAALTIALIVMFVRAVRDEAKDSPLSAVELVVVPLVWTAAGYFATINNVYDMLWFANENLVSPFQILIVVVFAWVFPFLAFAVLFKAPRGARVLAAPFFLLPTYIWTWLAANWEAVQAVAQSVKVHH